jgi:hypothetical protein
MKSTKAGFNSFTKAFLSVIAIMMLLSSNAVAQQVITGEVSKTYMVTLNDGSAISGT